MNRMGAFVASAVCPLILGLAACAGGDGSGRPLEIKLGHVGQPGSLFEYVTDEFARRVNERLAGQAELVIFGSSQLGGDEVLLQKLKLGTVDLSLPSTVMSSAVEGFGLFEMPYLVRDREHMKRIEAEIVWPELAPLAEAEGYKVLAVWENGFRHVTNSARPIRIPDDLAGIKLRTPRGRWRIRLFQAYGANPTPMPYSEVFVALQTGVMDGQENPLSQIYGGKFQEVQRYLSLTGHVYTPAYVTVGLDRWNRLPESVTSVIEETAREMQAFVHETAARLDADVLAQLEASGMQVNEADREAFVARSGPVYGQFAREFPGGEGLITRALALGEASADPSGTAAGGPRPGGGPGASAPEADAAVPASAGAGSGR